MVKQFTIERILRFTSMQAICSNVFSISDDHACNISLSVLRSSQFAVSALIVELTFLLQYIILSDS